VVDPGGKIQNSYSGLGHPEATPVIVTVVPRGAMEGGAEVAVTEVHGIASV
jgi:hypothetical protein